MFEAFFGAILRLSQPEVIVFVFVGALLGLVLGALPGLGSLQGLILVLPFTFTMDPVAAMFLYTGIMGAGPVGGSIPAILIRIPGTGVNLSTILDGYPMAQKGEAAKALGISATASALGTFFGLGVFIAVLPVVRSIVLAFGPPEYFMLVLWGLTTCVIVSRGNMLKGLVSAGLGLAFSFIGASYMTGVDRYTFGSIYLTGGISFIPFIIGLFGIGEILRLSTRGSVLGTGVSVARGFGQVMGGVKETLKRPIAFLRSAAIGNLIGITPGIGGAVANFVAYLTAMQTSRQPDSFGKGNLEGLLAAEASNNASQQGALLTMLSFGIPGGAEAAVLLAIFILHGLNPGPMLIKNNLDIVWALIIGMSFANIIASGIALLIANRLVGLTRIPSYFIIPLISAITLTAVFLLRNEIVDVFLAVLAGLFGAALERNGFSLIPMIIGLILGSIVEVSYHQSLQISSGSYSIFFTRPISLAFFILVILTLSLPFLVPQLRSLRKKVSG